VLRGNRVLALSSGHLATKSIMSATAFGLIRRYRMEDLEDKSHIRETKLLHALHNRIV
jgi:hypothetical protein